MEDNILYAVISVFITSVSLVFVKIIERIKFKTLSGSHKATGIIIIIIVISEVIYLAINLKLLSAAIEVVTSLSAILLFFTFIYLNKLQNAVSGMSISLGRRINIGTKIKFEGKHGVIIQIGLTKTIVRLDDSNNLMLIPNKKFDEEVSIVNNSTIQKTLDQH